MAGQIAELARDTLRREFRTIDPRRARVLLVEAADRVLTSFLLRSPRRPSDRFSASASPSHRPRAVIGIDAAGVTLDGGDGGVERIASRGRLGCRCHGVQPRRQARRADGGRADRSGRVTVGPDLTLPGHPEVFATGDMIRVRDPNGEAVSLPGNAPVAMQQGRYAASVRARLQGREHGPFHYRDKGELATIGRAAAVADIKGFHLSGFLAWVIWLFVHLWYLIGFQNRLLVLIRWSFSFATRRGARLITNVSTTAPDEGRPEARRRPAACGFPQSRSRCVRRLHDRHETSSQSGHRMTTPAPRKTWSAPTGLVAPHALHVPLRGRHLDREHFLEATSNRVAVQHQCVHLQPPVAPKRSVLTRRGS